MCDKREFQPGDKIEYIGNGVNFTGVPWVLKHLERDLRWPTAKAGHVSVADDGTVRAGFIDLSEWRIWEPPKVIKRYVIETEERPIRVADAYVFAPSDDNHTLLVGGRHVRVGEKRWVVTSVKPLV